jgi:hypothetical protein
VRVPDYIAPIVAYRLWRWDTAGLQSLNGAPWVPGRPLAARCNLVKVWEAGRIRHVSHDAPQADCRCGVYGSKTLDLLRSMRFCDCGVRGEVWLWGTVVEHEQGWRAKFAYPKALCLPSDALPVALGEIESRLHSLTAYRCDISILHGGASIPLWRKDSGLDAAGLDFLTDRGKEWYARRKQERTMMPGDRIAVGRGIAVVEHADAHEVRVLWNRGTLRLLRKDIAWDDINSRWEVSGSA